MCEDLHGVDSQENVDIFHDNFSGRALDPAGVRDAGQTELEFVEYAGVWELVPRLRFGSRSSHRQRTLG